jgi:hypothetical protein
MSLCKQSEKTHVLASAIPFCWFKPCKEWTEGPKIQLDLTLAQGLVLADKNIFLLNLLNKT